MSRVTAREALDTAAQTIAVTGWWLVANHDGSRELWTDDGDFLTMSVVGAQVWIDVRPSWLASQLPTERVHLDGSSSAARIVSTVLAVVTGR